VIAGASAGGPLALDDGSPCNRKLRFQANDFYDIYHAIAALPYCDVFLTEAFVGMILNHPPLALGKVFGTEIVWTENDALRLLRTLQARTTRNLTSNVSLYAEPLRNLRP